MNNQTKINIDNNKLIALWALSESGLGGLLHAFKIPVTGFLLGGFSLVIMTLLTRFNNQKIAGVILNATLIVVIIKFIASPHSPPMAYIAVLFQGIIGALIFKLIPIKWASILVGFLIMIESALQKVLTTTLIFGMNIWEALNDLGESISRQYSIPVSNNNFALWLILGYVLVYGIWGILVGIWSYRFANNIQKDAAKVLPQLRTIKEKDFQEDISIKKKRRNKWLWWMGILFFISTVFLLQGNIEKVFMVLIRTIIALLLLIYMVNPFIKWLMNRWLSGQESKHREKVKAIMDFIPQMSKNITPSLSLAQQQSSGIKKYLFFVKYFVIAGLFDKE